MLNHFRTLLLNETYESDADFIPKTFRSKTLPGRLTSIYNILFPPNVSKYYKMFLTHSYLNIIETAGLYPEIVRYDPRISYDKDTEEYFKIDRYSNPTTNATNVELTIEKGFDTVSYNDYYFDFFQVTQEAGLTISVKSLVTSKYLKDTSEYDNPVDGSIELTYDPGNSIGTYFMPVRIGNTGAVFRLIEDAVGDMVAASDLYWSFVIEGPFDFNPIAVWETLEKSNALSNLAKLKNIDKWVNMINYHFNPLFKLAAFICAFVEVVDSL